MTHVSGWYLFVVHGFTPHAQIWSPPGPVQKKFFFLVAPNRIQTVSSNRNMIADQKRVDQVCT